MALQMDREGTGGVITLNKTATTSATETTEWIRYPAGCKLSVILGTTGTAKVEITNASLAHVEADTAPADSITDWDLGDISSTSEQSVIEVCSAFRINNTTGTTNLYAYATRIQGNP